MATWTISKKLNVSPYAAPLVIQIKQYTSDFALKLQLYSTVGDLDIPAGATTKIRGTKRDGNGYELTGTRIGHTCTFSGTKEQMQQMTAAHGRGVFEVVVEHNGKELITANFYLEVQRAAMDAGTVTSESIIEEFADFQSKIAAAQAAATAAQEQADRAEAAAESIDFGIDSTPTQGSTNAVQSGGVYEALQNIDARLNALGATWSNTAISLLEQIKSHVSFIDSEGSDLWDDLIVELDGAIPATYYAITWNGRNFSKSNNAISAREEKPYTCIVSPDSGYSISALSVIHNGNTVTPIDNGDGTYTISIANVEGVITASVTTALDSDVVDICLFAGQSNMDGRGDATEATAVTTGLAYKWDTSSNTTVSFEAEPSLIPAYMQAYTDAEGVPLVEVKKAIGGTTISQYISDYLSTALTMLSNCKSYVESQGKTVRRVFMLWNQGETDAQNGTTTADYESYFATLKSTAHAAGINQFFIIDLGQYASSTYDYTNIKTALANVCNGTDVVMVSNKFTNATDYMDGSWHYDQVVYNAVGADAAEHTLDFFNGDTITLRHFDSSDVYGVPAEYGTVTDWTYELVNSKVLLTAYNGSSGSVRVYHQYLIDGYYYEARIARSPSSSGSSAFTGNTTITDLTVDSGVLLMNPSGYADDSANQVFTNLFKNCTNLASLTWTDMPDIVGLYYAFNGSALTAFNYASNCTGTFQRAFKGTALTNIGDLSGVTSLTNAFDNCTSLATAGNMAGTYSKADYAFQSCSALTSVGTIGSTSLTNITGMFNGCTHLAGVVRFESSSIATATNAFNNCDLTGITIQCPANSTTYTTISTAYPTANIVTF